MAFEIKPDILEINDVEGLSATISGLQQDQSDIQYTINHKQTAFNSPYKDWKVDVSKDVFVAIASSGHVAHSYDGVNWLVVAILPGQWLSRPTYANGKFVAISEYGQIAYSADGITWSLGQKLPDTINWQGQGFYYYWHISPIYINNQFVAVTNDGRAAYSSDGITWSLADMNWNFYDINSSPIFVNNSFYHLGSNGYVTKSTNAVSWSVISNLHNALFNYQYWYDSIAYGNGVFIAKSYGGSIVYSNDCITWNLAINLGSSYGSPPVFLNNKFIVVSPAGQFFYSIDGISWSLGNRLYGNSWHNAPIYVNGKFIVISNSGSVAISNDGIFWTDVGMLPVQSSYSKTPFYIKDKIIELTYYGEIAYSYDGVNWINSTNIGVGYDWRLPTYNKFTYTKTIGQILGI